jgi:hypothetical protein
MGNLPYNVEVSYDAVASLSSYFKDQPPEIQAVAEKAVNAVNYYLIGDVVDVVDELNGVRGSD